MNEEPMTDATEKGNFVTKRKKNGSSGRSERAHGLYLKDGSSPNGSPSKNGSSPESSKKGRPPLIRTQSNDSLLSATIERPSLYATVSEISSTSSVQSDVPVISVTKMLAKLQSIPTNRSCAECRSPLLDSSETFASFTPTLGHVPSKPHVASAVGEFNFHHKAFAPPGGKVRSEPVDPALRATQLVGGFGVFVCSACGAAHKSLGATLSAVLSVVDTSSWTPEQAEFLSQAGGNARSWTVFERYMPKSWHKRHPDNLSTHSQRLMFIRAKYDALAFLTPPGGPLAGPAWSNIVAIHPELERWANKELTNFQQITLTASQNSFRLLNNAADGALPSRLVDFFCVVGHSGKLAPMEVDQNLAERNSPKELSLDVKVLDCYPAPDAYEDMSLPEHISTFVFPDGCHPSEIHSTPMFFTFVLTSENGQRLYGAAMHVYDDQMDTDNIRQVLDDSGYTVPLPWWLHDDLHPPKPGLKRPSEVVYIPKCLVVLSHYPFYEIWRRFLTQIYRITLVQAPLPIERYIANFVSEVPLPPLGKVEVKFGFTSKDLWSISRPAVNDLPLANFSYRPLFASLSVGNIMVVSACLMQETQVALLSSHYALLGPVAEALLSLLFPFQWQGLYLPVMPFAMLDILGAPVPFIVGLHSRYLVEVPRQHRPKGVVFVDLDRDEVHLGFDDEGANGIDRKMMQPRLPPELPDKDANKLKAKLEECGGMAYLACSGGVKGRIFAGDGDQLQNETRPWYAQMSKVDSVSSQAPRLQILSKTDKAFPDNQQLNPIDGFLSEQGHTSELTPRDESKGSGRKRKPFKVKRWTSLDDKSNSETVKESNTSLLEMIEPNGFSGTAIRNAFLRFFVTIFNRYEQYLSKGSDGNPFRSSDFLLSLNLPSGSQHFVARVIASQMFQAFVQERKANPTSPSILFFDESIIAKNNRSRKTTLTSGGKHKTPFLDDMSGEITELFTPPPPSNWGLPGDGRSYHYGSFPALQADLFGKVRPPKQWPQQDAGTYRTVAGAAVLKQQDFINRSIKRSIKRKSHVPTLLANSGGRSGLRDMEWAIRVLSGDVEDEKNEEKIESRVSAQEQILAARRKQMILVDIITTLQSYCRMFLVHRWYKKHKKVLIGVQLMSRRTSPKNEQEAFRDTVACVVIVQKTIRSHRARQHYQSQRKAAMLLNRWARGSLVRCKLSRLRQSSIRMQAIVRGRRSRFGRTLLMMDISRAQAQARGYLARKLVFDLVKKRTCLFKQQIFLLWHRAHTPLAYRTKMYSRLEGAGFLSLNLAEGELQRLWSELDVRFPPSPRNQSSIPNDDHLAVSQQLGLSCRSYLRFTKVQAMLETAKRSDDSEDAQWFKAVGTSHWKKAADRETLERLQIYERLKAETDKATLQSIYSYFHIGQGDKKKKRTLVVRLWKEQAYASRSVSVMVALFPELEYGTYMNFVSPSRKGQHRYHVGNGVPQPLDKSLQVEVIMNQRIKSNMREFAMAFANRVPKLMASLDDSERKRTGRFSLQRHAEMYARRMTPWPRCRYEIIMDFLYPGRGGSTE